MVKVLKKTFWILEYVKDCGANPPLLGDIAEKAGLPQSTCSRIVKDLVEMEYLEQNVSRKGFSLGPKAYMLGGGSGYREDLNEIAGPFVKKCSEQIHESVLLAVMLRGKRYVLCHYNGNPDLQIVIDKPYYEDIYATATGRLLLAFSEKGDIDKYIKQNGIPNERWDGVDSMNKLNQALAAIRADGFLVDTNGLQLSIVAFPIFRDDRVVAALGASIPHMNFTEKSKDKIISEIKNTAEAINEALANTLR